MYCILFSCSFVLLIRSLSHAPTHSKKSNSFTSPHLYSIHIKSTHLDWLKSVSFNLASFNFTYFFHFSWLTPFESSNVCLRFSLPFGCLLLFHLFVFLSLTKKETTTSYWVNVRPVNVGTDWQLILVWVFWPSTIFNPTTTTTQLLPSFLLPSIGPLVHLVSFRPDTRPSRRLS